MKIAVLGCGAIGGLFLGYLSQKGYEVTGVVREYQKEAFLKEGLRIEGTRGEHNFKVKVDTKLREGVDLAIFSTKINNLKEIVADNKEFLNKALLLTTQNGIGADYILNEYFPKERIITGVVMFAATFYSPNRVVHNFEGDLIVGNIFDAPFECLSPARDVLADIFSLKFSEDIKGAKYLKVFINLNNCLPAILGESLQEVFSDLNCSKLAIQLNREAYEVVTNSGIELESLPAYPKDRIEGLVSMEINEAAGFFSTIITGLSKEPLYGSILQSIKRKKKSEIDYINGEIARLADANGLAAPLNKKIIELVKGVEDTGQFLSKQDLLSQIKGVVSHEKL